MTDPERAALIGQLTAARNVIDGALASLLEAQDKPGCEHPAEDRKYRDGTMGGGGEFTCRACGETVAGVTDVVSRITRREE